MEFDGLFNPCRLFPPNLADGTARTFPAEWRTEAVVGLARGIGEDGAFERLPILADALEESGCTDEVLLRHCREPMTHRSNCWAVNLALDRLPVLNPAPPLPVLASNPSQPTRVTGDHQQDTVELPWWGRGMLLAGLIYVFALVSSPRSPQDTPSLPASHVSPIKFTTKPNTLDELRPSEFKGRKSEPLRDLKNGRAGSWLDRQVNAAPSDTSSSR